MKSLLLLRHAKSSWKDAGLADHERPLNKRGKSDASRMGLLLEQTDLVPDRIISSSAKRARKTAARVAKATGYAGVIELTGQLYLAAPFVYVDVLRSLEDDVSRVLIVGHNPGMQELLAALAPGSIEMPTAALAHLRLPIEHWSELREGTAAELVDFWRPKDLPPE